ncbi:hypothetical protein K402DRAFT_263716 [Aulographum hederae CBS 113979]|uniref:Chromatin remodeling complex subunit n=1 Tax=Aulographum hederae CBS 113979 TaxID=1176131 RepID=A0A6G1H9R3_9PEZI|nr:hypothetical protein K402DRAFT_263716 [Aulographum hederae CBS 113979]
MKLKIKVSRDKLERLENGREALDDYVNDRNSATESESEEEEDEMDVDESEEDDASEQQSSRASRMRPSRSGYRNQYVDPTTIMLDSDDEVVPSRRQKGRATRAQPRRSARQPSTRQSSSAITLGSPSPAESSESDVRKRRSGRHANTRSTAPRQSQRTLRFAADTFVDEEEESSSDDFTMPRLRSDVVSHSRKRKLQGGGLSARPEKVARMGARHSDRATRHQVNMAEVAEDDIFRSDSEPRAGPLLPKIVATREIFETLPRNDDFRMRHIEYCDTCGAGHNSTNPLIYCQGCILAYHKNCIGHRTNRDHLVTKIGRDRFVLQCRRCVNVTQRRDHTAPDLAKCSDCNTKGLSCVPFRERKTPLQEQKERDDNDGDDPVSVVSQSLINNVDNVLFRCTSCWRASHFHHLPNRSKHHADRGNEDEIELAQNRFQEHSKDWKCTDCVNMLAKVAGLVAWRPVDIDSYTAGIPVDAVSEDDKEYLIKWEKHSYFRAAWMPGPWVFGVTAHSMRKAFFKKDAGPRMRTEDAIPEEYLRIDIVLDVRYTSIVDIRTDEIDKARIKEVDTALIKYKGLGYEDAVWEKVPELEDGDRWTDFVVAYDDWVLGRYVKLPKSGPLKIRLDKARDQPFAKLEKKKQPETVIGGELMKYQMDGLNWLFYQFYKKQNGILADEMGLGKTIQIISFLAMMVADHNCFPFLVVVPNSTCPNWRREIKKWCPTLRVVTYFGSATAREMAYKYELFPEGSKELRCHVVVTSYDAAADDSCRKFFKSVAWQGLIVDEGQRLKNDKSQLHNALKALRTSFRILITGTPLQNNARELFNLLQFLDDKHNAERLEEEYSDMNKENIMKLHDLIRPYILRRTKAQVLTFLPPMAQIIVPVSMSVLQKKLYRSILAKNPDLLRALFMNSHKMKPTERASLSNILMQLRKCLCHPFVYNQEIEERDQNHTVLHRNLVEASSKLQLLKILLPKLQERGHRVLIFSQFLNMLDIIEDFLDGLGMMHQRLDGTISTLEKQKRIDEFNAPDSRLFAFLLSTRAGGVGINLATADTVIILDPDFNPHQDIQALSRAHRIGQKNKVLCFQFMTRASAEEKIVQIGRKKMALDHVIVEQLDADDAETQDVESILRHGASELFQDGDDKDIKYDSTSVDKLLDRSQMESTKAGADNSAESQFSFARVWANDQGSLEDTLSAADERPPDPTIWDRILKEREKAAAAEAALRQEAMGRGKRSRGQPVSYALADRDGSDDEQAPRVQNNARFDESDDTDYQARHSDAEESPDEEEVEGVSPGELGVSQVPARTALPGAGAGAGTQMAKKPSEKAAKGRWNALAVSAKVLSSRSPNSLNVKTAKGTPKKVVRGPTMKAPSSIPKGVKTSSFSKKAKPSSFPKRAKPSSFSKKATPSSFSKKAKTSSFSKKVKPSKVVKAGRSGKTAELAETLPKPKRKNGKPLSTSTG